MVVVKEVEEAEEVEEVEVVALAVSFVDWARAHGGMLQSST